MIPLESSALAMTLIALESALCVTAYTSAGSVVGIAASRLSTASCICRPCAFDALHRERSARVLISGRTASASVVTVQILQAANWSSQCPTDYTRIGLCTPVDRPSCGRYRGATSQKVFVSSDKSGLGSPQMRVSASQLGA
jgi:hypothetical protein